jgi:hypothetical protein
METIKLISKDKEAYINIYPKYLKEFLESGYWEEVNKPKKEVKEK